MPIVLSIDIGGTNTEGELIDSRTGKSFGSKIIETPKTLNELLERIAEIAETLNKTKKFQHVGVGTAGVFDGDKVYANNLPFKNTNVKEAVNRALEQKGIKCEVRVTNDARAKALAAARYGKYKANKIVVVTLGTGIGGAKIDSTPPEMYVEGFEPGQMLFHPDEPHVEGQIGSRTMVGFYKGRRKPKDSEELAELHTRGDRKAKEAMEVIASKLAHVLHTITQNHTPQVIVLDGGPAKWNALVERTREIYGGLWWRVPRAEIVVSRSKLATLGPAALFERIPRRR